MSQTRALPSPAAVTPAGLEELVRDFCPLYVYIGLGIESIEETLVCSIPLNHANSNHLGGVHAAVQWALAEAVGGLAYFAHPELGPCWIVVRDLQINFHKVARTGLRAEGVFDAAAVAATAAQLAATGRADYEVEITLRDTGGEVVTTGVGRYRLHRETPVSI